MNFEQSTNQSNQVRQISISHGSDYSNKPSNKFVPGGPETDSRRARLRSDGFLILKRPEYLALKS
jgi:hypothetical protein